MQIPEKLTLIGGSILLASTLIFTLKSQASNILPKVYNGMSEMFKSDKEMQDDQQKQSQTQADQAFNSNFQQAQQKGWQTGNWGTAKFYVDDQNNMYVGSGQLNGSFSKVVNDQQIKAINLDDAVQAPQDSSFLFADNNVKDISLTQINGLPNLDTSQTTSMYEMFDEIPNLGSIDLSHFDTHNVTNMSYMFYSDGSMSNLDLSHFDTHNVTDMDNMFDGDNVLSNVNLSHFDTSSVTDMHDMFFNNYSLSNLDLSNFDTHNVDNIEDMFDSASIHQLNLGNDTKLNSNAKLSGTYQSNGQTLSLDGNAHPGTWVKQ